MQHPILRVMVCPIHWPILCPKTVSHALSNPLPKAVASAPIPHAVSCMMCPMHYKIILAQCDVLSKTFYAYVAVEVTVEKKNFTYEDFFSRLRFQG